MILRDEREIFFSVKKILERFDSIWTNNLKYDTGSAIIVDPTADHISLIQSITFTNFLVQKLHIISYDASVIEILNINFKINSDPHHAFKILLYNIQLCFFDAFPL